MMPRPLRNFAVVFGVLSALSVASCSARSQKSATPAFIESGFLTANYSDIKPISSDAARRTYVNPDLKLSQYDKIYIDRITIWRNDEAKHDVDSDDFQRVVDSLYTANSEQFSQSFTLAKEPGPGVARMRLGLVAIDHVDDRLDVYVSDGDTSPALEATALPPGLRVFGQAAWMEAELLDAESDAVILAVVDRVSEVMPRKAPIKTWQDLQISFQAWAAQGARYLSEVKGQE